ncbi:unnamed protein product [Tenebrio molitor]|jgi:hypothetical protein|nr:unnamed protein product [Tenebrio molitor]
MANVSFNYFLISFYQISSLSKIVARTFSCNLLCEVNFTMKTVLLLLTFAAFCHVGHSLECYACSVGEQDVDRTCVDSPEQIGTVNCNKKYCTTIRQEYLDPKDKVASMFRGCEDEPLHMNEIIEDGSYRFYYTACQVSLCNGGSGKSGDDSSGNTPLGDKSTLLVPGTGNGSTLIQISLSLILSLALMHYFV